MAKDDERRISKLEDLMEQLRGTLATHATRIEVQDQWREAFEKRIDDGFERLEKAIVQRTSDDRTDKRWWWGKVFGLGASIVAATVAGWGLAGVPMAAEAPPAVETPVELLP